VASGCCASSLTLGTLVSRPARRSAPERVGGCPPRGHDDARRTACAYGGRVIFKAVGDARPYPDHGKDSVRDWAEVPPRMVRLEDLITTKRTLDLGQLLAEDSTFYGDLFAHVVEWKGDLYLEDGLHRALRAALQQRPTLHARVLVLD
jgi:Arc/MetJ family transcription regulator